MKPLISYYGGKQKIARHIVEEIGGIEHKIYAEPFCGGCAVLFAKPRPQLSNKDNYREAINDTNKLVVNLYRVAKEQPELLSHWIKNTPYSREDYKQAVEFCRDGADATDIQKAWALYVNAQMSFAKKLNAGWGTSLKSENHASTWQARKSRLDAAMERLSEVYIDNQDALSFIDKWDHPDTLFYCDPPYPDTNQGHYSGYSMADFQALCDKLDTIQGSYILSCYPSTVEPESKQHVRELATTMSAARDKSAAKKRTEVMWVCDRNPAKKVQQLSLIA